MKGKNMAQFAALPAQQVAIRTRTSGGPGPASVRCRQRRMPSRDRGKVIDPFRGGGADAVTPSANGEWRAGRWQSLTARFPAKPFNLSGKQRKSPAKSLSPSSGLPPRRPNHASVIGPLRGIAGICRSAMRG